MGPWAEPNISRKTNKVAFLDKIARFHNTAVGLNVHELEKNPREPTRESQQHAVMYVCMYIYVCLCICLCLCVYICTRKHLDVYIYICTHTPLFRTKRWPHCY